MGHNKNRPPFTARNGWRAMVALVLCVAFAALGVASIYAAARSQELHDDFDRPDGPLGNATIAGVDQGWMWVFDSNTDSINIVSNTAVADSGFTNTVVRSNQLLSLLAMYSEFSFQFTGNQDSDNLAGAVVRKNDGSTLTYYSCELTDHPTPTIQIVETTNGTRNVLASQSHTFDRGSLIRIGCEVDDNSQLRLYFNNVLALGPITDSSPIVFPAHAAGMITSLPTTGGLTIFEFSAGVIETLNVDASDITSSEGTLDPGFDPDTLDYSLGTLPFATTSTDITVTLADTNNSLTIDGTTASSGVPQTVSLDVGTHSIPVFIESPNQESTKQYNLSYTRAESSNNNLSDLTIDPGTISPTFSPSVTDYTADVAHSADSIDVTATAQDSTATLTVDGHPTESGVARPVSLSVGTNPIDINVRAQDGSPKTYTLTVTRAPSSNAFLSDLKISDGVLSPTFSPATFDYTASVPNATDAIDVTATLQSISASMTIDGRPAVNNIPFNVNLAVGPNSIPIIVTAADGVTQRTYTITVTRAPSSNANLSDLEVDPGRLVPAFSPGTTEYSAAVLNSVTSVDVTATVAEPNATITVNGAAATSGVAEPVAVAIGENPIPVVVTAQDGVTTKTYTINLRRQANSDANLSSLTISDGTLTPTFHPTHFLYSDTVPFKTSSTNVTAILENATATFTINGEPATSGEPVPVDLAVGETSIPVAVTAQDGMTAETYTITVTRESVEADIEDSWDSLQWLIVVVVAGGLVLYTGHSLFQLSEKVKKGGDISDSLPQLVTLGIAILVGMMMLAAIIKTIGS